MKILRQLKDWGVRKINEYLTPESELLARTPESVEARLTAQKAFPLLRPEQKRAILKIIFEEVKRSEEEFGLVLARGHVYMEEYFYLYICHQFGSREVESIEAMRIGGFNAAVERIGASAHTYFAELKEYYFKQESGKPGSCLKYNCHLEAIRSRLMLEIFNDRI